LFDVSNIRKVMTRPAPRAVVESLDQIGTHLANWRKLYGLKLEDVAGRAGITRQTVARIESGDPGVRFEHVLRVCRAVGILDSVVTAFDPFETEIGKIRAETFLKERVRR
jgi:transcriptional regulator with XRE-family HTH domain